MTYNARMVVFPESTDGQFFDATGRPLTNEERGELLAQRILADGAEIVALQEVFDDDARRELTAGLQTTYPTSVTYLGTDSDLSDSGLMLFSKYPFEPMVLDSEHYVDDGDVIISQGGLTSDRSGNLLGFTEFDCAGIDTDSDCLATKGAGLVRIALPMGESLLVGFTHTRATYADDSVTDAWMKIEERRDALDRIGKLVADATAESEGDPLDAHVVVLGDLNIDGNAYHSQPFTVLDDEWHAAFSAWSSVPFTGCAEFDGATCRREGRALVDAWNFTTSPDDLGRTSDFSFATDPADRSEWVNGERLDYVLVRGPVGPGVVDPVLPQHLAIDWPLAGKVGELSDHLPLAVDLLLPGANQTALHSTPAEAADVWVPPTGDVSVTLDLALPGQMQWTKVRDYTPGTYTVRSSNPTVAFDVYASTDLSRPIEPRREAVDGGGWVYVLPAPPYYVRTFAVVKPGSRERDRSATGSYTLAVHEHQCKSPSEPCILTAGEAKGVEVEWPAGSALNPEDSMYFEFYADDPDVQFTPTFHEFEVDRLGAPLPKLEFEALDLAGALPLPDVRWSDLAISGDRLVRRADKIIGNPGAIPSYANHLLRVTRDPADLGWGGKVRVLHRTNLTYFTPLTVTVLREDDASAHDELRIYLDPIPFSPFHDTVHQDSIHWYASEFTALPEIDAVTDGGSPWPAASLGSHRLTQELPLLMIEDDDEDGTPEDGDFLFAEPHPSGGLGTWTGRALAVLALDRPSAHATWEFTDSTTVGPGLPAYDYDYDYHYTFEFEVSHTPPCFTSCP